LNLRVNLRNDLRLSWKLPAAASSWKGLRRR
jgi:hypothetical protein